MSATEKKRIVMTVRGLVQGVGFRPFVYRMALQRGLTGFVENSPQGVRIDIEGNLDQIESLIQALMNELPPPGKVRELEKKECPLEGYEEFTIRTSSKEGETEALILPDIATCTHCLQEVSNPDDRRYRYPFTNCTHCGPRFTIIEALPYDRGCTTMKGFRMCPACQKEYDDPMDRRFHAQPNACPECGPSLSFWDESGKTLAERDSALKETLNFLQDGKIVAVKGLGGFHLMVDATNEEAIHRLRKRKLREEKALALMMPNLNWVRKTTRPTQSELDLIDSPQAPITLIEKRSGSLPENIAPYNAFLGVMLPYTPLHHLLLKDFEKPIVATSGNRTDEPICFDEGEVVERLSGIADGFLVHNRPIRRYVDDSIARIMAGEQVILRRARGYAPLPVGKIKGVEDGLFAFGAHLKSTIAFTKSENVFLSHHIGDLETEAAVRGFDQVLEDFPKLYHVEPRKVVHDKHPDYYSSQKAAGLSLPSYEIQHHEAHGYSGIFENDLKGDVLVISWDGTGLGEDRIIWGSEVFRFSEREMKRVASLREFTLLGGDRASREPRRSALGLLYEAFGDACFEKKDLPPFSSFEPQELSNLRSLLEKKNVAIRTSSMGRFFDGVASILGLRQTCSYEAQAAIQLEQVALKEKGSDSYSFKLTLQEDPIRIDWEPLLLDLISDLAQGNSVSRMARRFHNTLAEMIVKLAKHTDSKDVLLTGGCFQNRLLTERTLQRLSEEGLHSHIHKLVPANDGGIAVGQIFAAAMKNRLENPSA